MRMTHQFQYWHLEMEKPRPVDCGLMCETIGRQETRLLRRFGSPTHQIARENTRMHTLASSRARNKRMLNPGSEKSKQGDGIKKRCAVGKGDRRSSISG